MEVAMDQDWLERGRTIGRYADGAIPDAAVAPPWRRSEVPTFAVGER